MTTDPIPPPTIIPDPSLDDLEAWFQGTARAYAQQALPYWWIPAHLQICGLSVADSFLIAERVWVELGRYKHHHGRMLFAKNRDLRPLSEYWMFGKQLPITDWEWKQLQIPRKTRKDKGWGKGGKTSTQRMTDWRERQRLGKGLPAKFIPKGKQPRVTAEKDIPPVSSIEIDIPKETFTFKLIRTEEDWEN